jgi:hypothetical protein
MRRTRRIHDVGAGAIVASLITECSIQYQYLFPKLMMMRLELRTWLVSNDRSCLSQFIALALKHAPFYPRFGAGDPRQLMVINHDPLAVIGIDIHGPDPK